ncbi:MAG: DUF3500 domain-containing protein [Verrucomicrobiales bacterium]|nr:DUF3500 domain-containing protein [Verrucomicrobiales bacterium]
MSPDSLACGCEFPPRSSRHGVNRRDFLRAAAAGLAATATAPLWTPQAVAAPSPSDASETLVAQLYKSLDDTQRGAVCFDFDHPLRDKVDNNWMITRKSLDDVLKPDQKDLVRQIYRGLHRPDFADRAMQQAIHDSEGKGFDGGTSIALFGQPGSGKFEFVLTGRHITRRCDGDSVEGAAFGGPIFYGHQAGDKDTEHAEHPGNVFWFQAKRANEFFQALDGKQRAVALIDGRGRAEAATDTVRLTGKKSGLQGLPVSELSKDQRELVRKVMDDLLAPFRKADADEAMKLVDAQGLEHLHVAFFKQQDLGNDGVWDVWQIEGPNLIWYFRGAPHVHCWAHVRQPAAACRDPGPDRVCP